MNRIIELNGIVPLAIRFKIEYQLKEKHIDFPDFKYLKLTNYPNSDCPMLFLSTNNMNPQKELENHNKIIVLSKKYSNKNIIGLNGEILIRKNNNIHFINNIIDLLIHNVFEVKEYQNNNFIYLTRFIKNKYKKPLLFMSK